MFRGENKTTNTEVAVKISTSDEGECNGRELFLLSHVQGHGHVVQLHDGSCSPYFLVLVMEAGRISLHGYMHKTGGGHVPPCGGAVPPLLPGGIVPISFAVTVGIQVASALEHTHSLHIIHRDLYAKNIVFRSDGSVMVIDFGMSIHVADELDCNL